MEEWKREGRETTVGEATKASPPPSSDDVTNSLHGEPN
jgi:hypothetical protein